MASLGPFELGEVIGLGGMSVVYRGHHRRSGQPAAVKVLTREQARQTHYRRALRKEVLALAKLHHPQIIRIYDLGEVSAEQAEMSEELAAGSPWLAMELVEGNTLRNWSAKAGWDEVRSVALDLLDALAHAHAHQVLHRDLKPSNILVSPGADGTHEVKLIDFGLTRLLGDPGDQDGEFRQSVPVIGTPNYMAPEQVLAQWREQGPWTDLYALGCVIWRMITGRAPMDAQDHVDILNRQIDQDPPALRPRFDVPAGTESWLRRMLRKSPLERFRRAADASFALMGLEPPKPEGSSEEPWSREERTTNLVAQPERSLPQEAWDVDQAMMGQGAAGLQNPLAPFPAHWRATQDVATGAATGPAGLGLFGVREYPLTGRLDERDRLWRNLERVRQEQTSRAVVLRGPSGYGKSRLARWLAQRAHEFGGATILRADHGPLGGPGDGMGAMLRRFFQCTGLSFEQTVQRMSDICRERFGFDEAVCRTDAIGLAGMITGQTGSGGAGRLASPRERHMTVARLVTGLARTRPVVLWLDELHWGTESIDFVLHLLGDEELEAPVLVVATVCSETLDAAPQQRELLGKLTATPRAECMDVGPLPRDSQRELVEHMLEIDDDLIEDVVEHAQGSPLFAVQLVSFWSDRGWLEEGDGGFVLASEGETPGDLDSLWRHSLEAVCEAVPGMEADQVRESLQLAAALGPLVEMREWEVACELSEVELSSSLVEVLAKRGIALIEDEQWHFAFTTFQDSLSGLAREAGDRKRQHRICARVLARIYPECTTGLARRRAYHLIEAGEYVVALEPLLDAADQAYDAGKLAATREHLDRRGGLLDELGRSPDAAARGQQLWREARLEFARGRARQAHGLLAESIRILRTAELPSELGRAGVLRGRMLRDDGQLDEARRCFEEASRVFARIGDENGLANSELSLGYVDLMQGKSVAARRRFEGALEVFDSLDDTLMRGRGHTIIAYSWMTEEQFDTSESHFAKALELVRRAGDRPTEAEVLRSQAELARLRQDWEQARRCTAAALQLHELCGTRNVHITRFELALVELGLDDFSAAAALLEDLDTCLAEAGYKARLPFVYAAQLACCAGQSGWDRWDDLLHKLQVAIEAHGTAHADIVWAVQKAAELARDAGREQAADAADEVAGQQRRVLE